MNYSCSKCNREYDSKEKYNKHVKSNRCKEPYECKYCNYITNRKSSYDKHINTNKCKNNSSKELSKNFKCTNCEATFRDNCDLQRHINKKVPCISRTTTINNTTNNNIMNNTINNTINNTMNNINLILSQQGLVLKDFHETEQYSLRKLPTAPNLLDQKVLDKFKETSQKDFDNYSLTNKDFQKIDNTRMLSNVFKLHIPKNISAKTSLPFFTSELFDGIIIKDNDTEYILDAENMDKLLNILKSLSEEKKEELMNTSNEIDIDALIQSIQNIFSDVRYKIDECLERIKNIYSCGNCERIFKTVTQRNNHRTNCIHR